MKLLALNCGVLAAAVSVVALAACSSETGSSSGSSGTTPPGDGGRTPLDATLDSAPPEDSGLGFVDIRPSNPLYGGFDGTHDFRVPFAVYGAGADLKLTSDVPGALDFQPVELVDKGNPPDNGRYFFVVCKQAGDFTIRAASGGQTATTTISVAQYAAGRWAAGEQRYKNGAGADPPCLQCHSATGIDHSPAALAAAADPILEATITQGIGASSQRPIQNVAGGHKWSVDQAELDGLVTYLRGLTPRGFR